MLGDFTNETLLVKKVNMDCLIWGGTVIPLLNCVQDKLNETMPSRKKKKNKIAPEIEELTKQLWFPLRDAIKTLTDQFEQASSALMAQMTEKASMKKANAEAAYNIVAEISIIAE